MKGKYFILLAIVGIFGFLISRPQHHAIAQDQSGENLFTNPGFEAGYFNQDNISQIAVPMGWRMHWLDNVAFEGTDGLPAYRPETVVWNIQDAPEQERPLFFRDGAYTLKVFKGWAPMYAALSQDVSGLVVGQSYRISAPIFIDIVEDYTGGNKVAPQRGDSGFVQFGVAPVGTAWLDFANINYSGYWTADNVAPYYLTQPIFVWDFVATAPEMTIWIEMGSRHPYRNNGFFVDGVGLYALNGGGNAGGGGGNTGGGGSAPAAPAPPLATLAPPEPLPDGSIVHTVSSNDTLWTIAIQYASYMGMAPEQALPTIQELNNNPAFISVGQQLLIVPPGENAAAEPEESESEAETEEAATAEEETAVESESNDTAAASAAVSEPVALSVDEAAETSNAVCVTVYEDADGSGTWEAASEGLQSDAAVTLFKAGASLSTHISDGINDSYCFEDLEADTYQVQVFAPANYAVTTSESWAIALAGGNTIPVSFGLREGNPEEVMSESDDSAQALTAAADETSSEQSANEDAAALDETGGFFSSVGGVVLIIALILLLLAGAGVAMLRRG